MSRLLCRLAILSLGLGAALPAAADRLPLPPDTPAAYRDECGSCHLAYPPSLLSRADWQRILTGLDRHFGGDARLAPSVQGEISRFLERHAGDQRRSGEAGQPPRLTQTAHFRHQHRAVPARLWRDDRVRSAANCAACHRGAADGRYSEHDLALPELQERPR